MPIILLNDKDIQLMHGKAIKRRLSASPSDWAGRDMCLEIVWEIVEADRYENLIIFLQISMVIDLHEEPRYIAQGIITNSISLA